MNKIAALIFLLCFISVGYLFVQGSSAADTTLAEIQATPEPGESIFSCKQHDDCIPVIEQCCGCDEGGRKIAINKRFYSHYMESSVDSCMLTSCPQVRSQDRSCTGGKAVCLNNQCQIQ